MNDTLKIDKCPHCSVDYPNMVIEHRFTTKYDDGYEEKNWGVYVCKRCGGAVIAMAYAPSTKVSAIYPDVETANMNLPEKVRNYLTQAIQSVATPAGSVMLSASAVDAMLKEKGLVDGTLYKRIGEAVTNGLLTEGMGDWAHQVRLEANSQRHADQEDTLPTMNEAKLSIEFVKTLGEILFVLPAKVTRGINNTLEPKHVQENHSVISQPQKLEFPRAYRRSKYVLPVKLDDSDVQPVVKARMYYGQGGKLLPDALQPSELFVNNKPGNPRWWTADFIIENCNGMPEVSFVEIIVNGHVKYAGNLLVTSTGV